jgi:predicted aminopeptidase
VAGLAVLVAAGSIAGCGSLRYYSQAVWGGAKLIAQREPIDRLLERGHLPAETRERLDSALGIRQFASRVLALPDNRSYRTYVETGREAVAWNVVAAPALSVEPRIWCFPIAGCVSYRGYFRQERAERFARGLAAQGMDTRVVPIAAFSTLGWFADPLVDTFLRYTDWQLAGLLFHELAHQVVYVTDDATFNESFATTVEIEGVRRWLEEEGRPEEIAAANRSLEDQATFGRLLLRLRSCLEAAYATSDEEDAKLARKAELFEWARREGSELIDRGELAAAYAGWFAAPLNNADVASVADYEAYVPALRAVFEEAESFPEFYRRAEQIAALSPAERELRLAPAAASEASAGCPDPAPNP